MGNHLAAVRGTADLRANANAVLRTAAKYCVGAILLLAVMAWGDDAKPKVAVFPLGGNAADALRDKVGFALRAKLDRQGAYEVIDGPTMKDLAAAADGPITFNTKLDDVKKLLGDSGAVELLWGELDTAGDGQTLKLHTYDAREPDAPPRDLEKAIKQPTDLRFATEAVLETLPGVTPFDHPVEISVQNDPASAALWEKNPNLVVGGDFEGASAAQQWDALLRSAKYKPPLAATAPDPDHVAIIKDPDGEGHVLAMNVSEGVAETNGLACISSAIPVEPSTRYRLQFRYKSDAPTLHIFVKGYSTVNGEARETYRRQVPPSGGTDGKWVTITDDMNPQNGQYPIEQLRVDLYIYLKPGTVLFDDVVLKSVGKMSHIVKDDAIKSPTK